MARSNQLGTCTKELTYTTTATQGTRGPLPPVSNTIICSHAHDTPVTDAPALRRLQSQTECQVCTRHLGTQPASAWASHAPRSHMRGVHCHRAVLVLAALQARSAGALPACRGGTTRSQQPRLVHPLRQPCCQGLGVRWLRLLRAVAQGGSTRRRRTQRRTAPHAWCPRDHAAEATSACEPLAATCCQ
jgi:hypothetical protein